MLVAEMATSSPEYRAQRVSALTALTSENPVIVITTVAGIRRFLPSVEYWKQHEIPCNTRTLTSIWATKYKTLSMDTQTFR